MESFEAEELGRYTSLSTLAVCAFLFGLASSVALLSPIFVVLPIAGALISILAILRIQASDSTLSGLKLAYWGLMLCVLCGVAGLVRPPVRDAVYKRQADEVGRSWLNLVASHQSQSALSMLTGNGRSSLMPPRNDEAPPQPVDPLSEVRNFEQNDVVAKLHEESKHGELEFAIQTIACDTQSAAPRVAIIYRTVKPDDSLSINVVLQRFRTLEGGEKWFVDSWSLVGEGTHNRAHAH